jgi:hypothetical protein
VELAVLAEHSGWDGVHLWDHLLYHDPEWPVASPVATAPPWLPPLNACASC